MTVSGSSICDIYDVTPDGGANLSGNKMAQGFIAGASFGSAEDYYIQGISIPLGYRVGTTWKEYKVIAGIQTMGVTEPNGTYLTSGSFQFTEDIITSPDYYEWRTIEMTGAAVLLNNGTTYAIVIECASGAIDFYLRWGSVSSGTFGSDSLEAPFIYSLGDGVWDATTRAGMDQVFKIYGTSEPPLPLGGAGGATAISDDRADLKIYYNSLTGNDYINCNCSRWDVSNYNITIECWMAKSALNTLRDYIRPGAVDELYTILGRPKYYDKTFKKLNTIRLVPNVSAPTSYLGGLRAERTIFPKNVTTVSVPGKSQWINVKIEGYISGTGAL